MDLRANAIITAVDRFSGPMQHMAGATAMMMDRLKGATQRFASFSNAAMMGLGALGGGFTFASQYDIEKIRTGIRAIASMSDTEMKDLNDAAANAAMAYGHNIKDMLQAGKDLIQGGLSGEVLAGAFDIVGQSARRNQEPLGQMAEKLIQTSRALGYSLETADDVRKSMTAASDLLSVAPNISTDSMPGFFTFLKYYAPIGRILKQSEAEMAALAATLADLGFKGEEGGSAMRTIMARLVTMTPKARAAFRAEGGQIENLFDVDSAKLNDMKSLEERIRGIFGVTVGGLGKFADHTKFANVSEWRDALMEHLTGRLGIGKGQAQDRKTLTAAIEQHVSRAISKIDIEKVFGELAKLETSLATDSELFGKQRLQQGAGLKQARALYKKKLELAMRELPGATARGDMYTLGTLSTELDRFTAAWSVFKDRVFNAGTNSIFTQGFSRLADGMGAMAQMDPARLNQIALAVGALVAIPAAGFALSAIGSGFGAVAAGIAGIGGAFAAAPMLGKLLMGGGLLALFDLPRIFEAPDDMKALPDGFGAYPKDYSAMPIALMLRGVSDLFKEISAAATDIHQSLSRAFGFDGKGSPLVATLNAMKFTLDGITTSIRYWRDNMPVLLGGGGASKPPGEEGSWWREAYNRYQRDVIGGLSTPQPLPPLAKTTDELLRSLNLQVQGQVSGTMQLEATIKVEGAGTVVDQRTSGGDVKGALNTGTSMPDTKAK